MSAASTPAISIPKRTCPTIVRARGYRESIRHHPGAFKPLAQSKRSLRWRSARERVWPRVRAVTKPRQPEWRRIDQGRVARDHVGDELAGPGPDAEAVAGKTGGDEEAGQALDRRDHRYRIGHHIDHAAPALRHFRVAEQRKGLGDSAARAIYDEPVGLGIEDADGFEGRFLVQSPTAGHAPFLDPAAADPEAQFLPVQPHRRQVIEEQPEMIGHEVDRAHSEG